jgi:hypothetical protein
MIATAKDVLEGRAAWACDPADNLVWLASLPASCCSLSVTSPPYEGQRLYGAVKFKLVGQAWVDWMIPRVVEMCRVVNGLVCINMSGCVEDRMYHPVVEWLVADLTRNHGLVCGPAPYVFFRYGIPGSGGSGKIDRYHRRDWEPVYAFARLENLPLKWTDATAMGHPPKWAPGGEMSNRLKNGQRVGKFGAGGSSNSKGGMGRKKNGEMEPTRNSSLAETVIVGGETPGLFGPVEEPPADPYGHDRATSGGKRANGERKPPTKHVTRRRHGDGERDDGQYEPPVLANPGNVIKALYNAEEVRQLFDDLVTQKIEPGDVVRCLVGGGLMGHPLCHRNEAPFPESLVEFFIRSYAAPGSIVLDAFSGSGTTGAVAVREGRRFIGADVRPDQIEVARQRISGETPSLFAAQEPPP